MLEIYQFLFYFFSIICYIRSELIGEIFLKKSKRNRMKKKTHNYTDGNVQLIKKILSSNKVHSLKKKNVMYYLISVLLLSCNAFISLSKTLISLISLITEKRSYRPEENLQDCAANEVYR